MAKELRDVREQLRTCFESLTCFLLPDPGKQVKRSTYSGKVAELDAEFVEHTRHFVAHTCGVRLNLELCGLLQVLRRNYDNNFLHARSNSGD